MDYIKFLATKKGHRFIALSMDDFPHILTQLLPLFKNFEYVDLIFQKNHFLVTNHPYFNVFKYYY